MTLPKLTTARTDHVVTLDDNLTVTFQIVPIPGSVYNTILDQHRDEDGKATHDAVAVPVLTAGIDAVYSSIESKPSPFTADDAQEIWDEWPEWARWSIYRAVVAYSTQGPAADPFGRSGQNANGDD